MLNVLLLVGAYLVLAVIIGGIVYLREAKPLFDYMRDKQPGLWKSIGMPEIKTGTGGDAVDSMLLSAFSRSVILFFLRRGYTAVDDPELWERCARARKPLVIVAFSAVISAAVIVPFGTIDFIQHPDHLWR